MDMRQQIKGVADDAKSFELYKTPENVNWSERTPAFFAGKWFETTEEHYYNMLDCMPPMNWHSWGFCMSEYMTGDVTSAYYKIGERYFHCYIDLSIPGIQSKTGEFFRELCAEKVE